MVKGNDVIPNGHFHKKWEENVHTDFGQPARKARRRRKRIQKALENPLKPSGGALRPVVRCPTSKYNTKVRKGKGFTLEELKACDISKKVAKTIGIAVDYRRRNRSAESKALNICRLKEYLARLITFTGTPAKICSGKLVDQLGALTTDKDIVSIKVEDPIEKPRAITEEERNRSVFEDLGRKRAQARIRAFEKKKAKEAAKDAAIIVPVEASKKPRRGKAAKKKKAVQTSESKEGDVNAGKQGVTESSHPAKRIKM